MNQDVGTISLPLPPPGTEETWSSFSRALSEGQPLKTDVDEKQEQEDRVKATKSH